MRGWKILNNVELYRLFSLSSIVRKIMSKRMKGVEHEVCMW
jgi:hypothetical protein